MSQTPYLARNEAVLYLSFNFLASVGIIFINKLLFESFKFRFTTFLTAVHYVVTLAGLEILSMAGVFTKVSSPTTPRLLALSVVVGTAPALNNLSLSLNDLGFYQVAKLLVTPAIVGLEAFLYGATLSVPRACALVAVCEPCLGPRHSGLAVCAPCSFQSPL